MLQDRSDEAKQMLIDDVERPHGTPSYQPAGTVWAYRGDDECGELGFDSGERA